MTAAKRLFVGLALPPSVSDRLEALDPKIPGVRWLGPGQMHLTLTFLGSVDAEAEALLQEQLSRIGVASFFLPLQGVGTFPSHGPPRVVWLGVGRGHPHLFQLHKRVVEASISAGFEPDLRPWHPHVTLARCEKVSRGAIQPFLRSHADFDAGMVPLAEFSLYSSRPGSDGSVYSKEQTVPLR